MVWTEERVEKLKKLWGDGLSATQIAKVLGEVTRNAVIGKVHRLGLPARATGSRGSSSRSRKRQTSVRIAAAASSVGNRPQAGGSPSAFRALLDSDARRSAPVPAVEEVNIPLHQRKTLQELTDRMCRWPIGDPQLPDFHFCGCDKVTGLPYCEIHARRAYQPLLPRKRERDVARPVVLATLEETSGSKVER